jgi:predicted nucleic acid-binding protein
VLSATLDSDTHISALNFGGTPLEVLNLARAGFIRLDVSDAILDEFAGVLRDKALNELVNNVRGGPPTPRYRKP